MDGPELGRTAMDGPKFGRAGARKQAARIGGWRPKNWKSGDQSRCRERPEFGNDPELEQCGPKIGKARQPAASGGSRRLEKSVFKYHKYCVEDGLSVDTPECRSGVSFLPAPADLPSHWLPRRSPPPPGAAGLNWLPPPPAAPSRRTLGSSYPPTPTRRLPGPPVSTGCCAGLFFPPAIPIDPPVSPFAGPPRRTGGVCLPFGRNGGRKCRSRLEYCAEFPSFVTPKHQYHEKPPPRTLCVCGLLQCSAGRMLRA